MRKKMPEHENNARLVRTLKNRHIQMIALGGAIGTGLYYGSAEAIRLAGPATILAYLIGGFIIYLIMRMLGEMSTQEPVAGAFSYFAYKYWGDFPGFFAGWNYWFLYILVSIAELMVVGIYLDHWVMIDHWKTSLIVLLTITIINLVTVRFFGEFEFWFALIKVLAVIGMIVFGIFLIITGFAGDSVKVSNLWDYGGFFPMGISGMVMSLVVIMFSFGGIELIGITAGEAEDPRRSIPRAIRQVTWRILLFYVGAMIVIMILSPWNIVDQMGSPFVMIFERIGIPAAGHLLNFVVITAAISVYNSGIYSNGRMLYGLAEQKNAPQIFMRLSRNHVPYAAILFSSCCTAIALVINYMMPNEAFMRMMAVVTAAVATTWAMIVLVHLRFRKEYRGNEDKLYFKAPFYPLSNYLCLGFLGLLILLMAATGFTAEGNLTGLFTRLGIFVPGAQPLITLQVPDMSISAFVVPVWVLVLYIGYRIRNRNKKYPG